ncbi:MAG: ester cyclase, partial [Bacteroidia bacterium]
RRKGKKKGEGRGKKGTGRKGELPYADVVRFRDGKAVEHWGYADNAKMFEQLQIELTPTHN